MPVLPMNGWTPECHAQNQEKIGISGSISSPGPTPRGLRAAQAQGGTRKTARAYRSRRRPQARPCQLIIERG